MDMHSSVGIDMGIRGGMGRVGQKWKNWDSYNRITIKMILKKE